MSATATIDVTELLGSRAMGRVQAGIVVLCALAAVLDGYDLQVIGLAAPAIAHTLSIPPARMGGVFSAALAGLALGSLGLGTLYPDPAPLPWSRPAIFSNTAWMVNRRSRTLRRFISSASSMPQSCARGRTCTRSSTVTPGP